MSRQRIRLNEGDAREVTTGLGVWFNDEDGPSRPPGYLASGTRFWVKGRHRQNQTIALTLLTLEGMECYSWQNWVRLASKAL